MRYWHTIRLVLMLLALFGLESNQFLLAKAIPNQQVFNSTQIYYRLASNESCGLYSSISLGDFIKKTLPFEWVDGWASS